MSDAVPDNEPKVRRSRRIDLETGGRNPAVAFASDYQMRMPDLRLALSGTNSEDAGVAVTVRVYSLLAIIARKPDLIGIEAMLSGLTGLSVNARRSRATRTV
jgi:hypothetical protein